MPQFDMILLDEKQVQGVDVLQHTAGSPAREGGRDLSLRTLQDEATRECRAPRCPWRGGQMRQVQQPEHRAAPPSSLIEGTRPLPNLPSRVTPGLPRGPAPERPVGPSESTGDRPRRSAALQPG